MYLSYTQLLFVPLNATFFTLPLAGDFCCYILRPSRNNNVFVTAHNQKACRVPRKKKLPVSFNTFHITCLPSNCCTQIIFVVLSMPAYKHKAVSKNFKKRPCRHIHLDETQQQRSLERMQLEVQSKSSSLYQLKISFSCFQKRTQLFDCYFSGGRTVPQFIFGEK